MKPKHAGHWLPKQPLVTDARGICRDFRGASPVQFSYNELLSNVSITATAQASAQTLITSDALFFDGNTRVLLEGYFPNTDWTTSLNLNFWDNATDLSTHPFANGSNGGNEQFGVYLTRYLTPGAGPHTFYLKGWKAGGTSNVYGGGSYVPAFLRVSAA